ncbi:MAG: putative cysteine cluster protein YcgN (CxxCxxCC family) [Bradymonadia bacterium]|jgi:uncharacterized cysteine cluster protein YcgN (CxxCxxCC family)
MTESQWESLCDGCAKCCVLRVEDVDDTSPQPIVYETTVACRLLKLKTCRCGDYENRFSKVPGCLRMTQERAMSLEWLPETCGYSRVARGLDLPEWHPLKSGDTAAVHAAGASMMGKMVSEDQVDADALDLFIVWPQ